MKNKEGKQVWLVDDVIGLLMLILFFLAMIVGGASCIASLESDERHKEVCAREYDYINSDDCTILKDGIIMCSGDYGAIEELKEEKKKRKPLFQPKRNCTMC